VEEEMRGTFRALASERLDMKRLAVLIALLGIVAGLSAKEPYEDREQGEVEFMMNHRSGDFNLSAGGETWINDYYSARGGVSLLGVGRSAGIYGAFYGGVRLSVPFYVSPFVGFSLEVGRGYDRKSEAELVREREYERTHPNFSTTNSNDNYYPYTYIVACYPEAGVRIWLNSHASLVGSVRYFLCSVGRPDDAFLYGGSLNWKF
jgi:hypothetical protein